MHTEGSELHETTNEARAGSTPNIVRWVLAISLLGAIVLLSAIWIFGAATNSESASEANATDRIANESGGDSTDSIVSDEPSLIEGPQSDVTEPEGSSPPAPETE